jgi:hypothetical protein
MDQHIPPDTFTFDPEAYGPIFASLIDTERLPELGPGVPVEATRDRLRSLDVIQAHAPHRLRDRQMARACEAGLWLLYDFLDESHTLSQEITNTTGSYWHGIMHRREPDFANAAYWFRQVGGHPIFEALCQTSATLAESGPLESAAKFLTTQTRWNPFAFIHLCEAVTRGKSGLELLCRRIQRVEWQLLFDFSYRSAIES